MEPYLKDFFFVETMVIPPSYLNSNLRENLRLMISEKYPEKTYQDKGYIFDIRVDSILSNKISLYGQIIFEVRFKSSIYTPEIGHVFRGMMRRSQKYQWIEIGPLFVYLADRSHDVATAYVGNEVRVQITSIKANNTMCYGKVIN